MHTYLGLLLLLLASAYLAHLWLLHLGRSKAALQAQALRRQLLEQKVAEIVSDSAQPPKAQSDNLSWAGWRKFRVQKVVVENDAVKSFYLLPHDGRPLPNFLPGQHLTFRLKVPGQSKPVVRCYSLSANAELLDPKKRHTGQNTGDAVQQEQLYYRVTIKHLRAPVDEADVADGLGSAYFHTEVEQGDILDVKAPAGSYFLDTTEKTPVVLVAGGVGLTPSLSMLHTLKVLGSNREVWLFNANTSPQTAFLTEELGGLKQSLANFQVFNFYTQTENAPLFANEFSGRLTCDHLQQLGAPYHADYYVCGPASMMKSIVGGLRELGVDEQRIHFESFGPASLNNSSSRVAKNSVQQESPVLVQFKASDKSLDWKPACGTLLETAESVGVEIDHGCRAGSCGTCLTAILKGNVSYIEEPGGDIEAGSCLPCIAIPKEGLILDA